MCIYDNDTMIGFTMYGMILEPAYTRLWFDRLLIDKQHQGKGYAKPAVQLILQEIRSHYPNTDIYLSVYAENHPAIALYRSFGFEFTGELDTKGEEIMIIEVPCEKRVEFNISSMFRVTHDTKHADLKEILALIRTKNPIGFELLYARYYRLLFSTAYAVLRQESDAMDAVQNAALRLYTMDESLFPSDHELAWLHTVVKNEALMVLRKKKPEHSVDELPEIPVPERQLEMLEDMETVQSMLSSLDQKRQNVVTLKVLGGLSHKEIAQLLSMPVGTVQWLYNTSIKSLRRTLTALVSVAIVSAVGLLYQAAQYFRTPAQEPGGDFGISSIPPAEPSLSPWFTLWLTLLIVSIVAGILFSNFPTKFQQSEILAASK